MKFERTIENIRYLAELSDIVLLDNCMLGFNFLGKSSDTIRSLNRSGRAVSEKVRKLKRARVRTGYFLDFLESCEHAMVTPGVYEEFMRKLGRAIKDYNSWPFHLSDRKLRKVREAYSGLIHAEEIVGERLLGRVLETDERVYPLEDYVISSQKGEPFMIGGNYTDEKIIASAIYLSFKGQDVLIFTRDRRFPKILIKTQRHLEADGRIDRLDWLDEHTVSVALPDGHGFRVSYSSCDYRRRSSGIAG